MKANLKTEYTDIKEVKHKVKHILPTVTDENRREQITEALCNVFKARKIPA